MPRLLRWAARLPPLTIIIIYSIYIYIYTYFNSARDQPCSPQSARPLPSPPHYPHPPCVWHRTYYTFVYSNTRGKKEKKRNKDKRTPSYRASQTTSTRPSDSSLPKFVPLTENHRRRVRPESTIDRSDNDSNLPDISCLRSFNESVSLK